MKGGIFLRKMPLKAYGSWIQQLWNRSKGSLPRNNKNKIGSNPR